MLRELLKTALAIVIGLLIGMVIVLFISAKPTKVFDAILTGPLPSVTTLEDGSLRWRGLSRFGTFLEDSTTLALVGLAVALPFRARQFSLGADGQLFLGALASATVSIYLPLPGPILVPLAFIAAVVAGFVWGGLPGIMKAKAGANEIVTTLMLNVIAIQFFVFCVTYIMLDRQACLCADASRSPSSNTSTASIIRAGNTRPSAGNHQWPSNRRPPNMSTWPEQNRCRSNPFW